MRTAWDFAAAAPFTSAGGVPIVGEVLVWSGATGAVLLRFFGDGNSAQLTREIEGNGDFDGDGHDDIAFGDLAAGPAGGGFSPFAVGTFVIHSGLDGKVLLEKFGTENSDFLGNDVAAVGDLDGNGHPDVAVGEPGFGSSGRVLVFGGPHGQLLLEARAPNHRDVGRVVSGGSDLDGDGIGDLVLGLTTPAGINRVLALSSDAACRSSPASRRRARSSPVRR